MIEWKILSLKSKKIDGCVTQITYQCRITDDIDGGARKIGDISIGGDPSGEGFIPYDNIMEEDALGWLYEELGSLKESIEAEVEQKIIDRAQRRAVREYSTGTPW